MLWLLVVMLLRLMVGRLRIAPLHRCPRDVPLSVRQVAING